MAEAIPILFQTARVHGKSAKEKAAVYQAACQGYPEVLAFELGTMFSPNGEIFDEETVRRLMDIPEIKGMKHSSLDRLVELKRLALRDAHRPDFRIYTGNDLGINMIEYGSDYLLGLAIFAPEKFAERDRLVGDRRMPDITRLPMACNIWETWLFASRFRLTNIPLPCSCIWLVEFLRIRCIRKIPSVRRGRRRYCAIVRAGSV